MQGDKLNKLKRLRAIRREGAERRYHAAARESHAARQMHHEAEQLASGIEMLADQDRKAYLKSLFFGDHAQTQLNHNLAVAAYLRTGQQIATAHENVVQADQAAIVSEQIAQGKRAELLQRENDERKLDSLMERLRLSALRRVG